jgi:REP element-mobilizing transposase RayT
MVKRVPQLPLELVPTFGWGGSRPGSGRKPRAEEAGISHERRLQVDPHSAVHVTLSAREHVWNLRSRRCHAVIASALRGVLSRADFRVVHFSVQGNHVHLVVEAHDADALARGMRSLSGRIAIGLNRLMGLRGRVFTDRYHAHVLRTPTEVRRVLAYVLGNFASHALRRGESVAATFVDPWSSAAERGPDGEAPPVSAPETWLLRNGGLVAREPEAEYGIPASGASPPCAGRAAHHARRAARGLPPRRHPVATTRRRASSISRSRRRNSSSATRSSS